MTTSRRRFLGILAGGILGPGLALAQSVQDQVLAQLRAQGFVIEEVQRTLLGRVRVIARRGSQVRELVFDPRNGSILRDFVRGGTALRDPGEGQSGTQGAGQTTGSGGVEDDDDDDDDDGGDDGDDGGDDDDD